ncbi:LysR family substrate-binding domain-containing protein [Streptacidiphilus sp. P02-A3a]|uniref:LysR family substrate-binding domain-containing protein n=1 Tax=Streptacidiphilus sp. P02-A3a TaxID=2704468 RepID=UPI0015FC5079|nr:LysR family substrate-binding domain-containing protein [Streptacidiphilus sp. P02-A3a]QMU71210.1 LysR family substrate-binding domain-containing protein [Streptacidiphilus sp. P02-A3a]
MTDTAAPSSFRLGYVPGVTPTKWVHVWKERLPDVRLTLVPVPAAEGGGLLRDGGADAGLLRLPVDRTVLSAIPLYVETTVVVLPKEHRLAEAAELTLAELAEELLQHPLDDTLGWERPPGLPAIERPATTADAVDLVEAGVGLLVVPQSLARLHHRRELTYRPVTDAPQSQVALSWPEERTTDLVEEFIGIVRGRTVNSSRGRAQEAEQPKEKPTKQARAKAGQQPKQGQKPGQGQRQGQKQGQKPGQRQGQPSKRAAGGGKRGRRS